MPSPSYILTRLLQIIPTFLFIMVVVFVLVRLLPGDPASAILGERATDEAVERINAQLGLDRPLPVQFALFLERFLEGDLGSSIHLKVPVSPADRGAAAGHPDADRLRRAAGGAARACRSPSSPRSGAIAAPTP